MFYKWPKTLKMHENGNFTIRYVTSILHEKFLLIFQCFWLKFSRYFLKIIKIYPLCCFDIKFEKLPVPRHARCSALENNPPRQQTMDMEIAETP